MLTKILKKRIILTTAVLFALSLMYILPKEKLYTLDKVEEELVYEDGKRINNSRRKRFIIIKRGFRKNETLNIIYISYK